MPWHVLTKEKTLERLGTSSSQGLTKEEVERRLEQYGTNTYSLPPKDSILKMILHFFTDAANIILLVAAGLSLALAIREGHGFLEPIVIAAIIVMNIVLSITQELSAEKALESLQALNQPSTRLLRDGKIMVVESAQIVPGDILVLKTGDSIGADARLVSSTNLYIDEASLTGESEPSEKNASVQVPEDAALGDQATMAFSGCLVTAGNATAVVVETGMGTQMGKIAGHLNNTQKLQTPLQKRLNKISRIISIIALVSAAVLLMNGLRSGEEFWSMMLAAVSLAVAAVPETLQLIVTLTLTQGVKKMVGKNALIRKLPAVETLGNTSVICSDKTGTLTQNRMAIQSLWAEGTPPIQADDEFLQSHHVFMQHMLMASNATIRMEADGTEVASGDATELAIMRLSGNREITREEALETAPRVVEIPFSSDRKMMTSIHSLSDGRFLVLTKGAFDRIPFEASDQSILDERQAVHDSFAAQALRVLALGSKIIDSLPSESQLEMVETDLRFEGMIGLIDPPRPEAVTAVRRAQKAGIRTVMITGDHAATAEAIGRQIGLIHEGEHGLTGKQLAAMSDEELIGSVSAYSVYARVSPEDKIRIVEAWQENGAVVSMTGDGVNDAPALKAADVGVAMGITGTDVAKSAADMVLTDDNFATIVDAVQEGRNVFSNIRKTIYFLLVCNLSEIVMMLGAQMMGWGIMLSPVLLLLINVLGDGIPGLRLAYEDSDPRIMDRPPIGRDESFISGLTGVMLQQIIAFTVVGWIGFYVGKFIEVSPYALPSHAVGQTMAFLVVGLTSIVHIFTVRSRKSIFKRTIRDNMPLLYSALAMIAGFCLIVAIPPVGALFNLAPLGGIHWLLVAGLSIIPTIVAEVGKAIEHRKEQADTTRRLVKRQSLDLL